MADNVYSSAKILTKNEEVQKYELGNFINNKIEDNLVSKSSTVLDDREINGRTDPLLIEIRNLSTKINEISQKVTSIENDGCLCRSIDRILW